MATKQSCNFIEQDESLANENTLDSKLNLETTEDCSYDADYQNWIGTPSE